MFNISSKADYGMIVLLELARNYGGGRVSLTELAARKGLSASYLTQIIQPLITAGLIESKEGKTGGYRLLTPPETVTVLDIIETLEGPANIVKCQDPAGAPCPVARNCEAKGVWPAIVEEVKNTLRHTTLADFI